MPIIEALVNSEVPLSQGDVLKGMNLYQTRKTDQNGGEPTPANQSLCLVLSRPCVASRSEVIVVAAIEKYKNSRPATFESFEEAKQFYTTVRDGLTTPDQFYLGQIDGYDGCFCARFNSLHTIQIPTDRRAFLTLNRIARLHADFTHDLHLRLFRAFASLGFEDQGWYPTADLRAVVAVADKDLAAVQAELSKTEAALRLGDSQGFPHQSEKTKLERERDKLTTKLQEINLESQPYKVELGRRDTTQPNPQQKPQSG